MTGLWTSGYARLAVLTALAAFVAYLLAQWIPMADPIPAAITAAVATRATLHHAAKETVFQILGALLGGAIALGVVFLIGSNAIVIVLLVLLCFALARLLHLASPEESPFVAASMSVTVILVVGTHLDSDGALERFIGVAIGALCALVASAIVAPAKDTRLLDEDIRTLQDRLSDLLFHMSRGLREAPDRAVAGAWREEAVEMRNWAIGLTARWEDLASHARWSPRLDPDELARLKVALDATSIMSARVLAIASDLSAASGRAGAPLPPAAVSPLADLMAMAADNIAADDPTTSVGRTQAHEAVRLAEQTEQIALIGGIVSSINRINQASAEAQDAGDEVDHSPT